MCSSSLAAATVIPVIDDLPRLAKSNDHPVVRDGQCGGVVAVLNEVSMRPFAPRRAGICPPFTQFRRGEGGSIHPIPALPLLRPLLRPTISGALVIVLRSPPSIIGWVPENHDLRAAAPKDNAMVGQNDSRDRLEIAFASHIALRNTKHVIRQVFRSGSRGACCQDRPLKIRSTRNKKASVIRHGVIMAFNSIAVTDNLQVSLRPTRPMPGG